jgi:hypothetical protein
MVKVSDMRMLRTIPKDIIALHKHAMQKSYSTNNRCNDAVTL